MAALNVRNVTLEQMASWKAAALAEGKTLREWVMEQLGLPVGQIGTREKYPRKMITPALYTPNAKRCPESKRL